MLPEGEPLPGRWVVSILVTGDEDGFLAVNAEGLLKTTLWDHPEGAQPVASTVARLRDLSQDEQDDWHRVLRRPAED